MARLATLSLILATAALAAETKPYSPELIRGLNPAYVDKYEATSGQFTCLDGSRTIPVTAINDDYCDCADGSDEPGTSACEGHGEGWFYCKNDGHIPGRVRTSRVGDGICDPECCDGSDEWQSGLCPNQCVEIGRVARERAAQELKTRKTGSKIRNTYIKWAQGEKTRLTNELASKREEVKSKETEVKQLKVQLEKTEARSKDDLEKRKKSPLYTHILTQKLALTSLRSRTTRLQSEIDTLHNLLSELKKGYNPNGQDMAVKAAVVGYEEFLKGDDPASNVLSTSQAEATSDTSDTLASESVASSDEQEITDRELDEIDRKDLDGLLLSEVIEGDDDEGEEDSMLYRIDEYIPDVLYDQWESVRDFAIDWMIRIGFLGRGTKGAAKGPDGPHVAAARGKYNKAESELTRLQSDITKTDETLTRMQEGFGPEAEWKKLDGTCIDYNAGEYTYEFCFFGKATQKNNRDGSSNYLGFFEEWKVSEPVGSFEYYTRQSYRNGAKCWNGPHRSLTVDMVCGKDNAVLSISEPEKCEYHMKATSPALCWPIEDDKKVKEEL